MSDTEGDKTKLLLYNRIIFALGILGFIIAIYVLQSFLRQTSIVCVNDGCEAVRKSPYSYPFGIPVPLFGLIGYGMLIALSFCRTLTSDRRLLYAMFAIGLFGILFMTWFTAVEILQIKALCTWCAISGINMAVIFALTVKVMLFERRINAAHR